MIIYISGKYTDDTQEKIDANIVLARKHAIKLWEAGYTVICPHLNTANFEKDCSIKWKDYIKGDLEILSKCDAILMLSNANDSKGAKKERDYAIGHNIPVFYTARTADFHYLIDIEDYFTKEKVKTITLNVTKSDSIGVKHDDGKLHWSLVDYKQIEKLVDILTHGEKKYAANNWMRVDNFNNRYFDALMRHITAWKSGEKIDKEWNKSHLSHAMANLMFLMWGEDNGKK